MTALHDFLAGVHVNGVLVGLIIAGIILACIPALGRVRDSLEKRNAEMDIAGLLNSGWKAPARCAECRFRFGETDDIHICVPCKSGYCSQICANQSHDKYGGHRVAS